jgi:anhydro-N-acetylmuramic acid kinase
MTNKKQRAMVVAGVMSGTSADGVDVAFCRVSPGVGGGSPKVKVLGHRAFAYSKKLRAEVLKVAGAREAEVLSAAEMARLNWRLGEVYAECVAKAGEALGLKAELVACHGQTVYHQGAAAKFLGEALRCTWQMGEAAVIAERLRVPVVSDFRPADMAAGGQGAPLVPMLDSCVFRSSKKNRVLLNLGGIANLTVLPAGAGVDAVMAFDTGPANMVIDAVMMRCFGKAFDRGGAVALRGKAVAGVGLRGKYFELAPPKSCGREEFGSAFVDEFVDECEPAGASKEDVVATAVGLTVESVASAYERFCLPHLLKFAEGVKGAEMLVAGGGAKNRALMRGLAERLKRDGVKLGTTEVSGIAVEAKEAAAFALMGWLTWHGMAGNVPSATGARRAVVLGKVSLP